ncbi:DNA-formamidopyrimidine glycosylase family protein [Agromyces sp. Marseille-Q5079]|uniref:DNA-formamidopyrimidine glycosylase family protein n=1 Tax=Agromyces sp. Marseille-Q5079 TaxID=3439059 RepID=UPI003D9CA70D
MPEGDTVFQTAARLRHALVGETLTRTDFRVPRFATLDLSGRAVDEVLSRGKHLLVRIGDVTVHSHLRMEGRWSVFAPGERWNRPAHLARAVLETPRSVAVGFELGVLEVVPRTAEAEVVGHLGPDLLGPDWDAAEAVQRIRSAPDVPIAVALLDQRNLAGLGNVYVNELCFLRGIRPQRAVVEVPGVEAVVDLGRRLLVANRDRAARVTTGVDQRGRRLWVYGRAGEPCRRCGTRIERGDLGRTELEERVTFWCPSCQR